MTEFNKYFMDIKDAPGEPVNIIIEFQAYLDSIKYNKVIESKYGNKYYKGKRVRKE